MNPSPLPPPALPARRRLPYGKLAFLAAVGLAGLLGLLAVAIIWDLDFADIRDWLEFIFLRLQDHPGLVFLAIAILPSLVIPVTPLLLLGGVVFGNLYGIIPGALLTVAGILTNTLWTYPFARYLLRHPLERFLKWLGYRIPVLPPGGTMNFVLIIRLTPGIPLCFQNYLLGVLRLSFHAYFWVGAASQATFAAAIALTSGAFIEGNGGFIFSAVAFLVVVVVILNMLRKKFLGSGKVVLKDE